MEGQIRAREFGEDYRGGGLLVRLTVVGSVNLDLVARVERLPLAGETVSGTTLQRYPGGKGANQALAASRLGAEVKLLARVGRDAMAEEALALLRGAGVDLAGVGVDEAAPTGLAMIAVSADGENQIVVVPGANHTLMPAHVDGVGDDEAVLCQLEIPIETVIALAQPATAKAGGARGFFALNVAPARTLTESVLRRADLIIANESESRHYGAALHRGEGLVAITYGADGAALFRKGREVVRATPPRVIAVDSTGAGDAFCAALTLALIEGQLPAEALRFACAAGALATTRPGAQTSLPTRAEVERVVRG
jgi:ribokinase